MMVKKLSDSIIIKTDGGSRGNPGPAGIGVVIEGPGISRKEMAEYIGETTNNVAEYSAVISGLKKTKALLGGDKAATTKVEVYSDSELLVQQLGGKYKIKETSLQSLFMEVWNLRLDFKEIEFIHVPREKNQDADRLVNQALDRQASRLDI